MAKKKIEGGMAVSLLLALVAVCVVEVLTNVYWNKRVVEMRDEYRDLMFAYEQRCDEGGKFKASEMDSEDKFEDMRDYAWGLEKALEKCRGR